MLPAECEAVLSRNNVGRIAFALHDRVNIVPINYVYSDGWVYGRTAAAGKLRDILRNRRIAFEVDEHVDMFEWRSVIVRGPLYLIQPDTTQRARSIYKTALAAMRRLMPAALTTADPVPYRDQLFRIRAADVSGRSSTPVGGTQPVHAKSGGIAETAFADADAELLDTAKNAIKTLRITSSPSLHLEAFDGVLAVSGTVETARDRQTVEAALLQVPDVVALVQELETEFPSTMEPSPAELARGVREQMLRPPSLVGSGIKVVVEHGWLRLEGIAPSLGVWDDVIRRVRQVKGSRGVIDRLRLVDNAAAQAVGD
jgi:nitroimidazol reductase NimA-like FMN-containing flavoprotein (pyridoxamine 5'-phosphate oxidase superfamily)/osmotically-inducible protein OsmY